MVAQKFDTYAWKAWRALCGVCPLVTGDHVHGGEGENSRLEDYLQLDCGWSTQLSGEGLNSELVLTHVNRDVVFVRPLVEGGTSDQPFRERR